MDDSAKRKTEDRLSALLTHASDSTAYYSASQDSSDLQDFPVINKNVIRENYDQFISRDFDRNQLKPAVTSGSTGTPFKVLHDRNKVLRNTADTLYFSSLAGYELGQRLYYLKIWNKTNRKSRLSLFMQNIVPVDVSDQSNSFLEQFSEHLNNDKAPKSLLGYASAFEVLCSYLEEKNIEKVTSKAKSVITMSEALNNVTKQNIKKYFDCQALARYSNIENGILAQQMPDDDRYALNRASYYFELLEMNSNDPVELGEPGRIVVTDLFNYGMPLIRYDTGDIGIFEQQESGELLLARVEGRRMDMIYNSRGKLVSSYIITNNMWKYVEIKQYQFIQKSANDYCFRLSVTDQFDCEEELVNEFEQYFGEASQIEVEYVSEIPLLSSGKRKKVVNEMYQM